MSELLDRIVREAHARGLVPRASRLLTECADPLPDEVSWTEYTGGVFHTTGGVLRQEPFEALGDELKKHAKRVVQKGKGTWIMAGTTPGGGCRDADVESVTFVSLDCDGNGDWHAALEALDEARIAYIAQRSSSHTEKIPKWHLTIPLSRPWRGKKPEWRCIWRFVVGFFSAISGLTVGFDDITADGAPRPNFGFDHTTDRLGQPIFIAAKRSASQAPPETITKAFDVIGEESRKRLALDLDEFLAGAGFDQVWFEEQPAYEPQLHGDVIPADSGLLVRAFREAGMLGRRLENKGYCVECPYEHCHSTGKRFDSSTLVFDPGPGQDKGWFKCSHSCPDLQPEEVLALLPKECVKAAKAAWGAETQRVEEEKSRFKRGDHVELATELIGEIKKTCGDPVVADIGDIHAYQLSGLWVTVPRPKLSIMVQEFAGQKCCGDPLEVSVGDVSGATRLAFDRIDDAGFFEAAPKGLVFRNGFVEVTADGQAISPLGEHHRARGGYPFDYETQKPPSGFLKFLDDAFRDDHDKAEKILTVQEFFGACLVGVAPTYAKAIIAQGEGSNAKSALGICLQAAFPQNLISSIPPQAWSSDYERARLAGKRFNFVSELPQADILETPAVKAIITGELINARHIRQSPFDYKPSAGHYLCANILPATNDQTLAFWRRFLILKFNRCFENDPSKDPHIADKIVAAELPAIVVWGLEGAQRLMRQRSYTVPPSHHEAMSAWKLKADQVATFLNEAMARARDTERPSEPDWTRGIAIYEKYRAWAMGGGHRPLSMNNFSDRMRLLGFGGRKTKSARFYPVHERNDYENENQINFEGIGVTAQVTAMPSPSNVLN